VTPPKNAVILTHGDVDGVCAAAIAKTSYHKAEVEFTTPSDFISKLVSLSEHDCVIILDLGISATKEAEARAAFQKLSKTSGIIYIDHHIRPPGLTERSLACNRIVHKTDASTSELAWEFFKPAPSHDFIAVIGAIGDYTEKTPQMQGLIKKYGERRVYPEALFLEWALMVAGGSFKRGVVEELVQGKWPYQMSIMGEEADSIIRRQRTLERYVREKAEKICEHVMLIRDPPFKATGPAANILTNFDNVDVGLASRREGNSVYLSLRRHKESDVDLASLIEESALNFGGVGGGHKEAAGGKIPVEKFDEFLLEIRRRLPKEQLKRTRKWDVESMDTKMIKRKLFKEIIERERAEEELKEAEDRYRTLFEQSPSGILLIDPKTAGIIEFNDTAHRQLGYSRDGFAKLQISDFDALETPQETKARITKILREGKDVFETKHRTKDGKLRDILVIVQKTRISGKDVFHCIFHDITERKRAEEEIRKSEERYRSLVETLPDVIFSLSEDGTFTSLNSAFEKITGWSRAEWLGKSFAPLIHPDDLSLAMESFQKTLRGESPSLHKLRILSKSGEYYLGEFMSMPQIKDGKVVGEFGIAHDITERNRLEMALEKRMHDLGKRVKELRCLYNISEMVNKPGVSLEGIIQGTVDLIPPAWQYPEIACARITMEGKEYETKNFKETVWRQVSNIVSHDEQIGAVEVYYLKERPESDEGPFLKEERSLINAIAEQLGRITGHKKTNPTEGG